MVLLLQIQFNLYISVDMSIAKITKYGVLKIYIFHEQLLFALKFGVWCGVSCQQETDPLFSSATVNACPYQQLLS
jgi:hypothetical protein